MDRAQPIAILAVDDEPGVLALVRRCLDDQHITLIGATSGKDALDHWPGGQPIDLLLTDLRMPEMEGDELARQVRALQPDVRVLYLTSHADRLFGSATHLERHMDDLGVELNTSLPAWDEARMPCGAKWYIE